MAVNEQDIVKLVIDAENLSSDELNEAASDVAGLGKAAIKAEKDLQKLKVQKSTIESYDELGDEIKVLKKEIVDLSVEHQKNTAIVKKSKQATDEELAAVAKSKLELSEKKKVLTSTQREYKRLGEEVRDYSKETDSVKKIQTQLNAELKDAAIKSADLASRYEIQSKKIRENITAKRKELGITQEQIDNDIRSAELKSVLADKNASAIDKEIAAEKLKLNQVKKTGEQTIQTAEQEAAARKKLNTAIGTYETKLKSLNTEKNKGLVTSGDYIRKEEELRKELELTTKQVNTARRAIEADAAAEKKAATEAAANAKKIKKAQEEVADIKEKVAKISKAAAQEENASNEKLIRTEKEVRAAVNNYEQALKKLNAEKADGKITTEQFIDKEERLRKQLKATAAQAKLTDTAMSAGDGNRKKASKSTDLLTTATRRLAQAYTVLLAAQKSTEAIVQSVQGYGELEAAITRVQKTTNLARDTVIGMADEMEHLATNVTPTATNELLRYAEVAGQLGAESSEDILLLVAAADALNVSTNLAGDEAATLLTRILKMTGEGIPAINSLGSSVVELGNRFAVTEDEIVHMTKEIVTGTTSLNLGSAAAAAFGATLKESGQQAERSRTAMFKLSQAILKASNEGGDGLQRLLDLTGQTADEFEKNLGERPEKVLLGLVNGFSNARDEGVLLTDILKELGIDGSEATSVIEVLAKNSVRLQQAMDLSNEAFADQNRHLVEAAKAYADQESAVGRLSNQYEKLKVAVGEALADDTDEAIRTAQQLMIDWEGSIVNMMEELTDLGRGVFDIFSSLGVVFQTQASEIGLLEQAWRGWGLIINGVTANLQLAAFGLNELELKIAEYVGSSEEHILHLKDLQKTLADGIKRDFEDYDRHMARLQGRSSATYDDLISSVERYGDSVTSLSDVHRAQLNDVLQAGTYNKDLESTYRELVAALVRANREKEIENALFDEKQQRQAAARQAEKEEQKAADELREKLDALNLSRKDVSFYMQDNKEKYELGIITRQQYLEQTDLLAAAEKRVNEIEAQGSTVKVNKLIATEDLSAATRQLKLELIDEEKALKELTFELDKNISTDQERYELTKKQIAQQEKVAELKRQLAIQTEYETKTNFQLIQIQSQLNNELELLEGRYRAGAITAAEFAEEKARLAEKTSILNDLVLQSADANDADADSTSRNSVAKEQLSKSIDRNTDSVDRNTDATEDNTGAVNRATRATNLFGEAHAYLKKEFDFSGSSISELSDRYSELEGKIRGNMRVTSAWWAELAKVSNQGFRREQQIISETVRLKRWEEQVASGNLTLSELNYIGDAATKSIRTLGSEQLSTLRSSISAAKRELSELADTIDDAVGDVQDRLDRLQGDEQAILKRQFQREIDELTELMEQATANGDNSSVKKLKQALLQLQQAQRIEMKQLIAESQSRSPIEQLSSNNTTTSRTVNTVEIKLPNSSAVTEVQVASPEDADNLITTLSALGEININGVQ